MIDAAVLNGCPKALSLGQRCLLEGYSFRWDLGMLPVLADSEGVEQTLELDCLCPVLPTVATSPAAAPAEFGESTSAGLLRATSDFVRAGTPFPAAKEGPLEPKGILAEKEDPPAAGLDHALTRFPKSPMCDVCCQAGAHLPETQGYRRNR